MDKGFLSCSDELRKLLFRQAEKYNITFKTICSHLGISYGNFTHYANTKFLSEEIARIPDIQLLDIAKVLGVNVRIQLVIGDVEESIKKIKEDELSGRKEEGAVTPVKRAYTKTDKFVSRRSKAGAEQQRRRVSKGKA